MSAIRSTLLYSISGITDDFLIPIAANHTWIVRDIVVFSTADSAQIDLSYSVTGALLFRWFQGLVISTPAPRVELRHLVVVADDVEQGIEVKPYGFPWDVTLSGYILNGIYEP